ncbi:MAG TPA: histidinol-phosphate aminotransferase family protein [Anaerolineae bacterium]|nr:histidinol-phosphate aminotransferase family protein [Anaerolineae bacterium]
MPVRPRPEVEKLTPAVHGGPDYAELAALGLSPDEVIDFSANANPYGPSPRVRAVLAGVPLDRYPDAQALALRERLAQVHRLTPDHVIVGNGTTELIWLLGMAYLQRGDPVVIIGPTFGEYCAAAGLMGARVIEYRAPAAADFQPDVNAIAARIQQQQPRLTFLCNPNNPTGLYLAREAVETLAAACGEGLLVVDEAYRAFVAGPWPSEPLVKRGPGLSPVEGNVVLLRSMTKNHALAGLRLGYALASPEVVATLRKVQPSWSVNAAAQAAGLAALSEEDHLRETLPRIAEAKAYLAEELTGLGLRVVPSAANFLLVEVGDGRALRRKLLSHGLMVRDCTSFGLPEYVRIAARRMEECRRLIETLHQLVRREA